MEIGDGVDGDPGEASHGRGLTRLVPEGNIAPVPGFRTRWPAGLQVESQCQNYGDTLPKHLCFRTRPVAEARCSLAFDLVRGGLNPRPLAANPRSRPHVNSGRIQGAWH